MGMFIREVGKVKFRRITGGHRPAAVSISIDAGDVIPGCTEGEVTVRLLEDKRVFTPTEFAAFCNEDNAKLMVEKYVRPLLTWLADREGTV